MTPDELLQLALEEYPEYSHIFTLEAATNYLENHPDGDLEGYFYLCCYIN